MCSNDAAGMELGRLVIVDAHEENVAGIFRHFGRIVPPEDLADGRIGGVAVLQLNDECRLGDMSSGNHDEVGIALSCGIFAVDDVFLKVLLSLVYLRTKSAVIIVNGASWQKAILCTILLSI